MTHFAIDAWHRLHILWRMMVDPAGLFQRINALDWYHTTLRQWTDELGLARGDTLLEIGCGTGDLSRHIATRGVRVCAVDRSSAMLAAARSIAAPGVTFEKADANALPFASGSFSHVIAASLINVVPDPVAALAEMKRVCAPGGRVCVLVPDAAFTGAEALIRRRRLQGFSRAALRAWHAYARKLGAESLHQWFAAVEMQVTSTRPHLDGMLLAATASKTT
jgi:ubiquinone/menaquinone biosynthesis C-methylase UbiE